MKIGIDARVLYAPVLKGIGVYFQNLVEQWAASGGEHTFYFYYDTRQEVLDRLAKRANFIPKGISIAKGDQFYFWEQFRLPREVKKDNIDVFFAPANSVSGFLPCPAAVTVHDTILQEVPRKSRIDRIYYQWIQPFFLGKAAQILTPSEFSKKNIERILNIEGGKITVIPQGIDSAFCPASEAGVEAAKRKYGISGAYIFNAGGESVWKNVPALIQAYSKIRAKGFQEKLVITGIRNPEITAKHQNQITELGLQGSVIILGYVSKNELIALYSGARIFVYPSLMEGFGFPPLEAMACGAAVAASDACSIPEVTGDAAVLFDGKNVDAISQAMLQLLEDAAVRGDFQQKGRERAKLFSWENTARRTLAAICEAGSKGKR